MEKLYSTFTFKGREIDPKNVRQWSDSRSEKDSSKEPFLSILLLVGDSIRIVPESHERAGEISDLFQKEMAARVPKSPSFLAMWANKANENRERSPQWSGDCGKIVYEGHLLAISSNFYPQEGSTSWSGSVIVIIQGKGVTHKDFNCISLRDLKSKVESYVDDLVTKIESQVLQILK